MSIANEITRLQTAKANIKSVINNKGGSLANETISSYATAINNLPSGDLTIEGQQTITGILTGAVDEFDTVYSEIIGDGGNWEDVHNKLSITALPNAGNGVSFSSDGTYLAVVHSTSPYLTVYKRSGDTFTKITGITAPAGTGRGVSFSSNDTYLAVGHESSPSLTVYKRSGDTFTKLSGITALPAYSYGYSVSFSSDDTYLAVGYDVSPYLTVYKRSGDTFTKISGITAPGTSYGVSFSSDDTYLAVGHYSSPGLTVYKRSGDKFTKLSGITALPERGLSVSFSSNDTYLAVGHISTSTPFLTVYKRSGDTFTKISGIEALPNAGYGVAFSSNDTYLAVAHWNSPYLTVYKTTLINQRNLISPALNTIPLKYDDLGYAKESGDAEDVIEMVSIFR